MRRLRQDTLVLAKSRHFNKRSSPEDKVNSQQCQLLSVYEVIVGLKSIDWCRLPGGGFLQKLPKWLVLNATRLFGQFRTQTIWDLLKKA